MYDDHRVLGARLKIQGPGVRQAEKVRIDVGRDRDGEFFDVRCHDGVIPEVLDARPASRHLVLMVRDGSDKNKFLLGHDERHWFAAAVLVTVFAMFGPQSRAFGPPRSKAAKRSGKG